jgi:ribosomal protein S18 acetylase RimI-like enzyme
MTLPAGITLRPIDAGSDLPAVSAVFEAYDIGDVGHSDHQTDWIVQAWKSAAFAGAWLAERDGVPVGYLELEHKPASRGVEAFLPVIPEERTTGLRAALLGHAERRARELVPDLAWVRAVGTATDPTFVDACRDAGYALIRTWWHMERSIDPPPVFEPLPGGVTIGPSEGPQDDPMLHAIVSEAFSGHFDTEPQTLDEWRTENEDLLRDRELVLVARIDGEPAGVETMFLPDGLGWIGELGVLERFRGRGIGRALLLEGFRALASRGATKVRLNVDSENETGATRLYTSVGMREHRRFAVFEKPMEGAEYATAP